MKNDPSLPDPDQLLLGCFPEKFDANSSKQGIGFGHVASIAAEKRPWLQLPADRHLTTISPTGGGKGKNLVVPNLLLYRGSALVVDIKGELAQVTARYRREVLGQKVYVLDPFGRSGLERATLNPLDVLLLQPEHQEAVAEQMVGMLFPTESDPRHQFWDSLAQSLVAGLLMHSATQNDPQQRTLSAVYDLLFADDFEFSLAKLLDAGAVNSEYAQKAFISYCSLGDKHVRPDTLATARSHLNFLASSSVKASLEASSLNLADLRDGEPMTVYLVLPPDMLESHSGLLRCWVGVLLKAITARQSPPKTKTVFFLDEIAQLGGLPILQQCFTLLRGYGLTCWAFWQNPAQLRRSYPTGWETMLDNSAAIQTFGLTNYRLATDMATVLGQLHAADLLDLDGDDALTWITGEGMVKHRRIDYLHHPLFNDGRYDPNRMFTPAAEADSQAAFDFDGRTY